jgi:hypothetical protein
LVANVEIVAVQEVAHGSHRMATTSGFGGSEADVIKISYHDKINGENTKGVKLL